MQLPNHCFLKNNHVAALNYAMPCITHSMLLPYELPASEVYISYFAMFLYILNIFLSMIIFFLNPCLRYLVPFSISLSGPGDTKSGPGSVPVDINVIYIRISWPPFSH